MKRNILSLVCILLTSVASLAAERHALSTHFSVDPVTGALAELSVNRVNWLTKTDGTQYPWVTENFGWGLGYATIVKGRETVKYEWRKPASVSADSMRVVYRTKDLSVDVDRRRVGDGLSERYTFRNTGQSDVSLYDIGIYTPFNDNYPDASTCLTRRTHVHVWPGGDAAYVRAMLMGGKGPNIGLVVTQGSIENYEIWGRGIRKGNSQMRGVFALNLPDMTLRPGECYTLAWTLFVENGKALFLDKLHQLGSVSVESDRYIYEKGDIARVVLTSGHRLSSCEAYLNGVPVDCRKEGGKYIATARMDQAGEAQFEFRYDGNKHTEARCLVFDNIGKLINARVEFIRRRQQMNDANDPRYGAYMVYDNEGDSIYLNNTPNCNPVDRDEGAERTGMGVLLAKQYLLTKDPALKTSLVRYAKFFREKLQTDGFKTFSSVDKRGRNRGYNYMWAADFYFLMYHVTGEKRYATYGYETLQAMFRQFGYGFYAIDIPVQRGLQTLRKAGMEAERKRLLADFRLMGDTFVKNGLNYPKHEVNYEQSIVAPAIHMLLELYQETRDEKYLAEAKRQLPVLEAFGGFQPSYHLNDVAIRHWDGYWFGKRELFGDTFPHYWSTITAGVFHLYAQATGDAGYQHRAENIVRNNLCLFSEEGRASCAYLYPHRIDGVKGAFYDPYANDQDWALVYYLLVCKGI